VKGGSSFNALVRAMKQDLIDNGTAAKDPALLYEIDKVSASNGCCLKLRQAAPACSAFNHDVVLRSVPAASLHVHFAHSVGMSSPPTQLL
jgi:hypothetical protein